MAVWRLQVNTGGTNVADYCLKNHVAAMGWSLRELTQAERSGIHTFLDYCNLARTQYKSFDSVCRMVEDVKEGDLLWMRSRNEGKYYIARVKANSTWVFREDAVQMDAANQLTNIDWYPANPIKQKVKAGKKQTEDSKKAQQDFYEAIVEEMNQVKGKIDIESKQLYDDLFTKRGSVVSGSEETVYYIARLISIAKLTKHSCPIIMDSFRAEDLSTEKEERVLALLSELKRQCILTTTLKAEEKDKYVKMAGINAIDYTGHHSNKILGAEELPAFMKLLSGLGISLQ